MPTKVQHVAQFQECDAISLSAFFSELRPSAHKMLAYVYEIIAHVPSILSERG